MGLDNADVLEQAQLHHLWREVGACKHGHDALNARESGVAPIAHHALEELELLLQQLEVLEVRGVLGLDEKRDLGVDEEAVKLLLLPRDLCGG